MQELMTSCFAIDSYCEHEQSVFNDSGLSGNVICTKRPREIPFMRWAMAVNPDLYVIYVLRDPRDVVVSRHKKAAGQFYTSLKVWKESEKCRSGLLGHKRFLVVTYEDMVGKPELVQRAIEGFLPFLQKKADFSHFHQHAKPSGSTAAALNGLRPLDVSRVSVWQQYLPRLKAQFQRYGDISSDLVALGYESDGTWLEVLEGVEADNVESVMDDNYLPVFSLKMRWRVFRKVFFYALAGLFSRGVR